MTKLRILPRAPLPTTLPPPRTLLWLLIPIVCGLATMHSVFVIGKYYDFRIFWEAGRHVLDGHSPYPPPTVKALSGQDKFVYPAPAALLFAPFALLPLPVADGIFLAILYASVIGGLLLLGVRDIRCFVIGCSVLPVMQGIALGTVSPLLFLLAAAAWRLRHRAVAVGSVLAFAIVLKLFLAPLCVWLLATRRFRAALWTAGLAGGSTLAAWAVLGFAGMRDYPQLLHNLSVAEAYMGFSLTALAESAGVHGFLAQNLPLIGGALGCLAVLWRGRQEGGDRDAFAIALGAGLLLSPIVWLHYFVLAFVPIALYQRRFSPIWGIPAAGWLFAHENGIVPVWKVAGWYLALAIVWTVLLRGRPLRVALPVGRALAALRG